MYAASDSSAVPFATIYNKTKTTGTMTNLRGAFSIKVNPADTIRISAVGFENYFFIALESEKSLTIYLAISTHEIDTIIVRAMPPKELFKQEFMQLELPEENKVDLYIPERVTALQLPLDPSEIPVLATNDIRAPGLSFSTFMRGKADKMKKKESEVDRHKQMQEDFDRKYSNEFIGKLTGLHDADQIAELKKFCKFTNDFILQNSEYDIAVAIIDCYKEFEKTQN